MKAHWHHFIVAVAIAALRPAAAAEAEGELLELINAYRAAPPPCEGTRREPLPPLAPDSRLARLEINGGGLQDAMRAAGYQASRAESLTLTGPTDAAGAMRFAAQHYCRLLLSGRYSVAGVSRQGSKWMVVLAQPRLDPDLGDWRDAGHRILKQVNAARAGKRRCGDRRFEPAPPLRWSAALGAAALRHSRDMAEHGFFGHQGRDGNTVDTRAAEAGYAWRSVGENVAAGQGSPQQVVDGWLSSPGHCANIMNGRFTEMGAAYAINPESDATIYWTQVFGAPR